MEKTRNTEEEKKMGQKWVKENFTITNFEYAVYLLVYEILFFFSLSIKPVNKEETNTTVV